MEPAAAATEARRGFGNVTRVREELRDGWGIPAPREPDAGRPLRRAYAAAGPGIHGGRGAVALARHRRGRRGLQRGRRGAVPAAVSSRSRDTARFPRQYRPRRRREKRRLRRRPAEIEAMRRTADFADLIAFRGIDDVAWTIRARRRASCAPSSCRRSTSRSSVYRAQAGRLIEPPIAAPSRFRSSSATACGGPRWPPTRQRSAGAPSSTTRRQSSSGITTAFQRTGGRAAGGPLRPARCDRDGGTGGRETMARLVMRLRPGISTAVAEQKMGAIYKSLGPSMAREGELQLTLGDASRGVSDARERTALADCARAWCWWARC